MELPTGQLRWELKVHRNSDGKAAGRATQSLLAVLRNAPNHRMKISDLLKAGDFQSDECVEALESLLLAKMIVIEGALGFESASLTQLGRQIADAVADSEESL